MYMVIYGDPYENADCESWICANEADAEELVLSLTEEYVYEQYCNECLDVYPWDIKDFWEYFDANMWSFLNYVQIKGVAFY